MPKFVIDAAMDAELDYLADCDLVVVCSTYPTTYTEAATTYKLADIAVTAGNGNGDFTIADGDTSGRKLTTLQQASIPIDADGDATHIAWLKSTGSVLKRVTTCTTQGLTSGGTVTIPANDHEIADPT